LSNPEPPMPRFFFFDVEGRGCRITDAFGMDLDDLSAAMCEAVSLLKLLAFESRFITGPGVIRVTFREQVNGSLHEIVFDYGRS
jgi:hypothetical protein